MYGHDTLADVEAACRHRAKGHDLEITFCQTNAEGELIDWIQKARTEADAVILNAGGYTHTSVALRDAVAAAEVPVVEVHISNIHKREEFRQTSLLSPVVSGVIAGFGLNSYVLAVDAAARLLGRE